jgi:hypothetical protein
MQFPNASNVPINMLYPHDFTAFEMLDRYIQHEYVDAEDFQFRGMAAALGIVKGKPFKPDAKTKAMLNAAAETAWRMGHVMNLNTPRYYTDRKYIQGLPLTSPEFNYESYRDVDRQGAFFTLAYSTSPLMFLNVVDIGSKYPTTLLDANGEPFNGSKTYKLHLPPNIPAKLFWSVTLYDPGPRCWTRQRSAIPVRQSDGQADNECGRLYRSLLRFHIARHGQELDRDDSVFDQTWKPDDVVKVQ